MNTDNIHAWLKELGYKIAEHAEPLKGMGGDHDYDGVINIVWRGIHEALGVDSDCEPHMAYDCELSKYDNQITYTGPPQSGGPMPAQDASDAFVDGYAWARVIDQVYDLGAAPNRTQEEILNIALDRAEHDHDLMKAIIDAYRNTTDSDTKDSE